ncbi:MAG TPA: lipopolysaccharide biosynthesis protein [Gammaproteobacteria bacterium]|nr:lipopolysaccharide biosynthesis protein [Gammaproteobacteria bacterium]
MTITARVIHSLKWMTFTKFLAQLLRWAVTFIVIRLLMPEDYGVYAMADVVMYFFALFSGAGLASALIQVRSFSKIQMRQVLGLLIIINLALALAVILVAPWVAEFYREERVVPVLYALLIGFLTVTIETLPTAMLEREMRFKALSLIELAAATISAIVTLILALSGYGVWSLVFGHLSELLLRAGLKFAAHPVMLLPQFRFGKSIHLITFGGIKTLTFLAWFALVSIDTIIGGRLWDTETLGIYAVALQLSYIPMNKLVPLVKQVAFPAYAKIHQADSDMAPYIMKANGLILIMAFPIFFGFAATASSLVPLLLGEKWLAVIIPASMIPLILPFRASQELMDPAFEASGRPLDAFKNWLIVLSILAPMLYIGALYGGIIGMCWAWVIGIPVTYIITSWRAIKYLQLPARSYIGAVLRPLFAATVMFAVIHLLRYLVGEAIPDLPLLILEVAIGAVTFLAMAWLVCRRELFHLFELGKQLKG